MRLFFNALLFSMFVLSPNPPVLGQATKPALELSLVTEVDGYRIEFGRIGAVVADGQGRMYVADVHEIGQVIAILDSSGVRIGTIGGRGEGPGEFKNLASSLGWMGDTLVAMDHRYNQTKVKFFHPGGRVAQTSTLPSEPGLSLKNPRIFSSGPRMFLLRFEFAPVVMRTREQPVDPILPAARYEEITGDGSAISLPALSEPGSGVGAGARRGAVQCRSVDQMWMSGFSPPFTDRGPLRAFTPSGELAKGNVDSLLVEILDPESGIPIRSFSHETHPIPLTDEGWESVPEIKEIRQHEEEIFEQKVDRIGAESNCHAASGLHRGSVLSTITMPALSRTTGPPSVRDDSPPRLQEPTPEARRQASAPDVMSLARLLGIHFLSSQHHLEHLVNCTYRMLLSGDAPEMLTRLNQPL